MPESLFCYEVGRAFTRDRQWLVEKEDGSILQVIGGGVGTHNILLRGRDENRQVRFYEISGWAQVREIV